LLHPEYARFEQIVMSRDKPCLTHHPTVSPNDPNSPYYAPTRWRGRSASASRAPKKTNVEEYCISEGWIRRGGRQARDRYGNPLLITLKGPVEAYFKDKTGT